MRAHVFDVKNEIVVHIRYPLAFGLRARVASALIRIAARVWPTKCVIEIEQPDNCAACAPNTSTTWSSLN